MKRNRVPYAAYSDGDNAVLSKVPCPYRDDTKMHSNESQFGGVVLWNEKKENYVEVLAWAGAGSALSLELVDDFVEFTKNVYKNGRLVELLKKRRDAKESIGDMVFLNYYRISSVDAQGNGFYREGITADLPFPKTRGLRLYNGQVHHAISHGRVYDYKAGYKQKGFTIDRSGARIKARAKSRIDKIKLLLTPGFREPGDNVIELNNIHFRGKHKKNIAWVLQPYIGFEPHDPANNFSGERK